MPFLPDPPPALWGGSSLPRQQWTLVIVRLLAEYLALVEGPFELYQLKRLRGTFERSLHSANEDSRRRLGLDPFVRNWDGEVERAGGWLFREKCAHLFYY